MLLVKFGTVDMRPGSGRRRWTDENVDTVNNYYCHYIGLLGLALHATQWLFSDSPCL